MITPMKKVTILASTVHKGEVVTALRRFGLVHVEDVVSKTSSAVKLEGDNQRYSKLVSFLDGYRDKKNGEAEDSLSDERLDALSLSIMSLIDEESRLNEKNRALSSEIERLKNLGDFDPQGIRDLSLEGYGISLYYVGKKEKEKLREDENVVFVSIKTENGTPCIALINSSIPHGIAATRIVMPEKSLSQLENEFFINKKKIEEIEGVYRDSVRYTGAYTDLIVRNEEEIFFRRVSATVQDADSV